MLGRELITAAGTGNQTRVSFGAHKIYSRILSKKHRVSEDRDRRHAREAVFRLARVKREERASERNIVSRTIQL